MSVRVGALRLRILAGAAWLVAAALPAVAHAHVAPARQAAGTAQQAGPGKTGKPAQQPAVKPSAGAAAKSAPAQAQEPVAQSQKPAVKSQKPAPSRAGARRVSRARAAADEAERAAMAAKAPEPAEPVKDTVVVKPGDTLWDLSTKHLGSPWIWPRVYNSNRSGVKNPHWIYPGQKLAIPGPAEIAAAMAEQAAEAPEAAAVAADTSAVAEKEAPARRPSVELAEYLAAPWLARASLLAPVGLLLDRVRVESSAERLQQAMVINDDVYIRAQPGARPPAVGTELLMVRVERSLPRYGDIVEPTAVVRVERASTNVAVARIIRQFAPVLQGQRALTLPSFTPPAAQPVQPVERGAQGELIGFEREQPLHTVADLAFVSIGRAQGVRIGDELLAYAPARPAAADPKAVLPPEDVARLLVVKVEEHTATVRPLSLRLPSLQPGLLVRVVGRVP